MKHLFRLRPAGEQGFAMVTALLTVVVAALLGAVAFSLAVHNESASAYDRARVQAVHGAEAGVDATIASLSVSAASTLPCSASGSTTSTPHATWNVTIAYYATYPPSGTAMTCLPVGGVIGGAPAAAVMNSSGTVPVTGGSVRRTIQSQVRLTAVYGLFNKAIFSNSSPNLVNQLSLYGHNGNDADFYTNGSWACPNQTTVNGTVIAQGTIDISNSCAISQDAWANGAITMANTATVNNNVTSSTSSLSMINNSRVNKAVRVGTTCSGCTTGAAGR
ncbi:MAG TPA: hypothetical protein VKJ07_14915, partial [Mycobacteriales bacterium]|nr:hypothetical protein [Mycobacteriales bacterium]